MASIKPIPDVPDVPKVPRSWGLGAMVENSLIRFLAKGLNRAKETIAGMIRFGLDTFLEGIEPFLIRAYRPLLNMVQGIDGCPPELDSLIDDALSGEAQAGAALVGMLGQSVGGAMVGGVLSVALAPMTMYLNARVRPQRPDLTTAWALRFRDLLTTGEFDELMGETGWPVHFADRTKSVLRPRLDIPAMASYAFRQGASLETLRGELEKRGYIKTDIDAMFEVLKPIPGPGDLVRFALREAWRDDVAAEYGYDADRPAEFGEWMEKQGYSPEWAQRYWRSHWQVPSVGQAFAMLHRGVIFDDELDDLLKVQDIPSGWRDKLCQIAYTPLGRIDTRWALEEGLIEPGEVEERYKAQGYNEQDAALMTKIAVAKAVSETKGLTRSAVEKAYRKRRLLRGEAVEMLGELGILSDIAEFYLDQADQDREDALLDKRISAVAKLFTNGQLDPNGVYDRLGALGLATPEIEANIELWSVNRSSSVRRPSRANLDKFFLQDVIGLAEYRTRMAELEYPESDINLFLSSLAIEREKDAQEEERKTRDAQDKIRASRIKTDYQIKKAGIDTSIAELQEAIATAQVAVVTEDGKRDLALASVLSIEEIAAVEREYKPLLRAVDLAIDESRLAIAGLQTQIGEIEQTISEARRSLAVGRDVAEQDRLTTERLTLDTLRARLATLIAGLEVNIREKKVEVFTFEDPAEKEAVKEEIARLEVEIAKRQEEQAKARERQEEIDALLQVTYTLEQRALIAAEIATSQALIAGLNAQADEMRQVIREAQLERGKVDREMRAKIELLPGKVEQVRIRASSDAYTDELRSTIATLRANVATLRLEKSGLSVGYRESGL